MVTALDERGRLGDTSAVGLLGWKAGQPVAYSLLPDGAGLVVEPGGPSALTGLRRLSIPLAMRRVLHLEPGDRLLVAAHPDRDLLVAYTMAALDTMTSCLHQRGFHQGGGPLNTPPIATAELEATRTLLARLGITPDLLIRATSVTSMPTFGEYIDRSSKPSATAPAAPTRLAPALGRRATIEHPLAASHDIDVGRAPPRLRRRQGVRRAYRQERQQYNIDIRFRRSRRGRKRARRTHRRTASTCDTHARRLERRGSREVASPHEHVPWARVPPGGVRVPLRHTLDAYGVPSEFGLAFAPPSKLDAGQRDPSRRGRYACSPCNAGTVPEHTAGWRSTMSVVSGSEAAPRLAVKVSWHAETHQRALAGMLSAHSW